MSEEEIIKMLEHSIDTYIEDTKVTKVELTTEQAKVLLDLYTEQKEIIEKLANGIRVLGTNPDITTTEIIKEFTENPISEEYMEEFKSRYISKDKILKALGYKENDEEYKRIYGKEELILSLVQTINTECDRLEDIEDQKTMLEIHNIEDQRDKYWQEKIEKLESKYAKLEHRYKRLRFDHKFHIEFTRKETIDRGRVLKEISDLHWKKDEKSKYAMEILEKLANERYKQEDQNGK